MEKREQWGTRLGFIMAAVGSAIGLGNIWRFPYQVYTHGGGTFLIPYFFALFTAGIPILILEFALGHKYKGGAPTVFAKLSGGNKNLNSFEWVGWLQVIVSIIIATYYSVIVSWTISYTGLALPRAWGNDTGDFFFNNFLHASDSPLHMGSLNIPVLCGVAFVWGISWLILFKGIKGGIEKANKIFMPTLIALLLLLTIRSVFLHGAADGLNWLFQPDFSKLKDPNVWVAAYGQIFYSLSIGFAIMVTYSSYLPEDSDIVNNGFMTGLLNCGFSMISGIMIFSILGNMAQAEGTGVEDVVSAGIGLAFVTIPKAINYLPLPYILGPLFFLSLTIAGLSSSISISETIVTSFVDRFHLKRKKFVTIFCIVGFVVSSIFATGAGIYLLDIIDHYVNNFGVLTCGLIELVLLSWFFKLTDLRNYLNPISDFAIGNWWNFCLKVVTPLILVTMAINNFSSEINGPVYEGYSVLAIRIFGQGFMLSVPIITLILTSLAGKNGSLIPKMEENTL